MRRSTVAILLVLLACVSSALAESPAVKPVRPVNTYSIVAYDSATGAFGAAVQSHWFKVADVSFDLEALDRIWAEPGVGVVATQSLVDFAYGPLGLEMMKNGKSASQALAGLLVSDPQSPVRQVAMIDQDGVVAVHTLSRASRSNEGNKCIAYAGHQAGRFYSVQANLMRDSTVWGAMAEAFESTDGDLAERMMAALEAAEGEGGDIRGRQSAAMIVTSARPTGQSWRDRVIDIRVDDSPDPLVELRRLLGISRAYDYMNQGDELITEGKLDQAAEAYAPVESLQVERAVISRIIAQ